jgi:hypothetical protein
MSAAQNYPVNWLPGEDFIIAGSVSDQEARTIYANGWKEPRPYVKARLIEVAQRPDEVRDSFAEGGITHEQAHLIVTANGPMLVAAVEHTALKAASGSSGRPPLPLNVEHEAVMSEVLDGVVETTELLNFRSPIE